MADEAERIINGFKNSMFKGKDVHKMSSTGPSKCKVQLDEEMTTLFVAAPPTAAKREIPLESIDQIMVGMDGEEAVDFALDDLSVTLGFEDDEPIVLRFQDMEARDTFALCLGMFVDQMKGGNDEEGEYEEEEEEEEEEPAVEQPPQRRAAPARTPAAIPPVPTSQSSASKAAKGGDPPSSRRSSSSKEESGGSKLSSTQRTMKRFVETHVKGRTLQMLATTGAFVEVLIKLDRDITSLSIQRAGRLDGKSRMVHLRDVIEIGVGHESAHTEVLDDLLVTLLLEGETAIAFRFNDFEDRDQFAECLQTLVKGNRREQHFKRTSL